MSSPHESGGHSSNPPFQTRIFESGRRGLVTGLSTAWFLIKVMVPTILLVNLAKATGVLALLAQSAAPFMKVFNLPGEASLVLLTGALVNLYAAIAVAVNITLTAKSMTVMAIMILIAHNLVVETAVQSKAGTPAAVMLISRISASCLAGLIFARIIPDSGSLLVHSITMDPGKGWTTVITGNAVSMIKIALIVISLMIAVEIMREFGLMDRLMDLLHPPMKMLGMNRKTSFVAAVGLILGLAYGAGLIIDEAKAKTFSGDEILATNMFLGTNHAMIEDSLIFAAVGANLLWIVLGRLIFGSIFVRLAVPVARRWTYGVRGKRFEKG